MSTYKYATLFLARNISVNQTRTFFSNLKCLDVTINRENGVAYVLMKHPPVNTLNMQLISELSLTLSNLEKSKCQGMILSSIFDKVFCSGLDLNELLKPKPERVKGYFSTFQELVIQLYGSSFPTVAAMTGHSPAGGCVLGMCCEYRVMKKNSQIGIPGSRMGIALPRYIVNLMSSTIGLRNAELMLTKGKILNTDEALKVGLIDEIANDRTDAIRKAEDFLKEYEMIAPLARGITKRIIRRSIIEDVKMNGAADLENFVSVIMLPEVQEKLDMYMYNLKNRKRD
ncbi:hypothetical protein PPYR_10519 [Photinus pyralis]|uniref:Enoyl-CoA delta isomerase 1, mitochondrial n=2 Tax=Photinus pyralis TaxID=7054 RepID=A0A1Y1N7E6_PHOPY|nr:enoyl-CoA delta isomerase 1, mitochondrial-like [Photinus pyralis]KAB0796458.1 hypothetical protein PPYR_10519 [Photinus pyralis]